VNFFRCVAVGVVWVFVGGVAADVRLPRVLSSHMVLQRDKPVNLWGWADPGEQVTASFGRAKVSATAGDDGRWKLQLPAQKTSNRPQSLKVSGKNQLELTDVLVGEVWLCSGQSNMEWRMTQSQHKGEEIPKADHPRIRLFAIAKRKAKTPQDDTPHDWTACTPQTVASFSAVGYHFGQALHRELKVPIGLVQAAWGGTQIEPWTPSIGLEMVETLKSQAKSGNGGIYNGMIHPLAPLTMRGAIWYQGESNCLKGDTTIYMDRTRALVGGWRKVFGQDDLSFYFVQIAPFTYVKAFAKRNKNLTVESLPRFWEAQAACLEAVPHSGMVVVTDITGNVGNIHPPNKRDVGHRLARWALAKNYGRKYLAYSGPMYKSMKTEGSKVRLDFEHVTKGLSALDGKPLTHFTVAGADRKFVEAKAVIRGKTVEVSSDQVKAPVAVRFGWHETAIGNLGNKAGLPAAPFRTDDWE